MLATQEIKLEKNTFTNWKQVKLGEILKVKSGEGLTALQMKDGGQYAVYGGNGINGYFDKYIVEEPTLIIGRVGAKCGVMHVTKPKSWVTDNALMVNFDKKRVDLKFLYWTLIVANLNKLSVSTAQPVVSGAKIYAVDVLLPPLPEQHRIVEKIEELFSELDYAITTLKTTQQQLQTYRQSVLKHAFEGHFTGGMKGWKVDKVGNLIERMQYGSSEKSDEDASGIPVLRMGNIQDSKIEFENLKYLPKNLKDVNDYLLNEGDVLFNRTNSAELVGKTGIYKKGMPEAVFASYLIKVVTNRKELLPEYFNYYMNSHFGKKFIKSVVSQNVGQANVNGTKLKGMDIQLPKPDVQKEILNEIETRLSESDYLLQTINQQLIHAESLRQSILQRAFSGEL